ncbi:hypothetical protein MMC09_002175 [Bachmanniomyces sp. S44760]|nr:hypothetical protein [Bachmanniomyces sp. S44760]
MPRDDRGSAIFQIAFLPSLNLSHSRSEGDEGLSGHDSSGQLASLDENAMAPSKTAVAQKASRSDSLIGIERLSLNKAAVRDQWAYGVNAYQIGKLDKLFLESWLSDAPIHELSDVLSMLMVVWLIDGVGAGERWTLTTEPMQD